jgi:hypothetical protein
MTREHFDAAGALADLVRRGLPEQLAKDELMHLAGAPHMMRYAIARRVLPDIGTVDDVGNWLRRFGYLPDPTRCRWCGRSVDTRRNMYCNPITGAVAHPLCETAQRERTQRAS